MLFGLNTVGPDQAFIFPQVNAPTNTPAVITSTSYPGFKLQGVNTFWSGTPFSVVSGPATILLQTVIDQTDAYLIINPNGATTTILLDNSGNTIPLNLNSGTGKTVYQTLFVRR